MRLRKDEQPLDFEEHQFIATIILNFIAQMDLIKDVLKKGFSEKSPISKKLANMVETANYLKYSLQQVADSHRKKFADEETETNSNQEWSNIYLGAR